MSIYPIPIIYNQIDTKFGVLTPIPEYVEPVKPVKKTIGTKIFYWCTGRRLNYFKRNTILVS